MELNSTLRISSLIGNKVSNDLGEDLGKIEDFVLDMKSRQIAYAVLSFRPFWGFGSKLFAIPLSTLGYSRHDDTFILNVEKERLKEAPGFDKDDWPAEANEQWISEVYRFYDIKPYWEEVEA